MNWSDNSDIYVFDEHDGFDDEEIVAVVVVPMSTDDLDFLHESMNDEDAGLPDVAYRMLFEEKDEACVERVSTSISSGVTAMLGTVTGAAQKACISAVRNVADLDEEERAELMEQLHHLSKEYGVSVFAKELLRYGGKKIVEELRAEYFDEEK